MLICIKPKQPTKQSDGETPVMPELWEMRSTPLSLPDLLRPAVVTPDMGQIELNCVHMLNWIVWKNFFIYIYIYIYI